jgi:hypothetical protein
MPVRRMGCDVRWAIVRERGDNEDQQLGVLDARQTWVGAVTRNEPSAAQPWIGWHASVTLSPSRAARHSPARHATRQSWIARDELIRRRELIWPRIDFRRAGTTVNFFNSTSAKDREGNLPWRGSSLLPERMLDRTWRLR